MKKLFILAAAAMIMVACTKQTENGTRNITICPKGDISFADFDKHFDITDVWVFNQHDNNSLEQIAHGTWFPSLQLPYGHNELYFVASSGKHPTINGEVIYFDEVGDTFWGCLVINVDSHTSATQYVNMRRNIAKLELVFTDTENYEAEHVEIRPFVWFNGIHVPSNTPIYEGVGVFTISMEAVPYEAYSAYTFSMENEWITDIILTAYNDDLGSSEHLIDSVSFSSNRITRFSGPIWSNTNEWNVCFNDEWNGTVYGEWQ